MKVLKINNHLLNNTLTLLFSFLIVNGLFAQLSITTNGSNFTVNFENTVTGVYNDSIRGNGFTSSPAIGQFDSDAWAATGWSDGSMNFGDSKIAGDYARGISAVPVSTGGFYAFRIATGNYAFGIQPGGSDWAPGTLTLKIQNNTGQVISSITLSYNIYVRNDQARANSFNFSHSADNLTYTAVPDLNYTSPLASSGTDWIIVPKTTIISGLTLNSGSYYYFRWSGADAGGSGSRDEFALNDLIINTMASTAIADPSDFVATAVSTSQVDLTWALNAGADTVMIVENSTNTFGTPSGIYASGASFPGGGLVLYKGTGITTSHSGLTANNEYFYKAWSKTSADVYSTGVLDSATTQSLEPTDHPSGITAVSNGPVNITVSWNDSDADHYLVKGSSSGYSSIVAPVDGVAQGDSLLVKNINEAVQTHQFTGLTPNTTYYFKIFPYNGTGSASNYKLDGTIPEASAVTDVLDLDLVISEVADPRDSSLAKFVEISNIGITTIDFSTTPVYLGRQSNGGTFSSLQISGTLTAGSSRVIGYIFSSADTMRFFNAFGFVPDQYSNFVSGNGDDGYFLYYGGDHTTGYRFDAYGVINVDGTSEPWEYTDKKAVRKRTVTGPSPTWFASEWLIRTVFALGKDITAGIYRTDITLQGNASTDWNARGANWNSPYGFIPDASSKVIIPNVSNYPVITEPSSCNQIEIQSGSALIIQNTGILLIIGQ